VEGNICISLPSIATFVAYINSAVITTLEDTQFVVPFLADVASEFLEVKASRTTMCHVRASSAIADVQILAAKYCDGFPTFAHADCDLTLGTVLQLLLSPVLLLAQVALGAFQTAGEVALVLRRYTSLAHFDQSSLAWTQAEKTAPEEQAQHYDQKQWDDDRDHQVAIKMAAAFAS